MEQLKQIWQSDKGDVITQKYEIHSFRLGDVDDPELYASQEIDNWRQTEIGKWAIKNTFLPLYYVSMFEPHRYGYMFKIFAQLSNEQITYFELRYK